MSLTDHLKLNMSNINKLVVDNNSSNMDMDIKLQFPHVCPESYMEWLIYDRVYKDQRQLFTLLPTQWQVYKLVECQLTSPIGCGVKTPHLLD